MELTSPADIEMAMAELALLRIQSKGAGEREKESLDEIERLRRKNFEFAADRDQWKLRAERSEPLVNGKRISQATAERDALRGEVSHLATRIVGLEKELKAAKASWVDHQNQASAYKARLETLQIQMENSVAGMQLARNKAQLERDNAVGQARKLAEELEAVKKECSKLDALSVDLKEEVNILEAGLKKALKAIRYAAEGGRYKRYTGTEGKVEDPGGVNDCLETLPKLLFVDLQGRALA